jgi:hypothetical protein
VTFTGKLPRSRHCRDDAEARRSRFRGVGPVAAADHSSGNADIARLESVFSL